MKFRKILMSFYVIFLFNFPIYLHSQIPLIVPYQPNENMVNVDITSSDFQRDLLETAIGLFLLPFTRLSDVISGSV